MNKIINNYLTTLEKQEKPKQKQIKEYKYEFKFEYNNGIDFVIGRYKNEKLDKELIFIPSTSKLTIRCKNEETLPNTNAINAFFHPNNALKGFDFTKMEKELNPYFYNLPSAIVQLRKDFCNNLMIMLKYGLNPNDFFFYHNYDTTMNLNYINDIEKYIKLFRLLKVFFGNELRKHLNNDISYIVMKLQDEGFNYNIIKYFLEKYKDSNFYQKHISHYDIRVFREIIDRHNLDTITFINYIFDELPYQGVSKFDRYILNDYNDYLNISKNIYGKIKDKYPKYLKTQHNIVSNLYNIHKKLIDEKKFILVTNEYTKYEYKNNEYSIISPNSTQEVVNEGLSLHHCVSTYIPKIIENESIILFMRENDNIDDSLLTIEIKNNTINQVRGLCQRRPNKKETEFLLKWAKKYNLESSILKEETYE